MADPAKKQLLHLVFGGRLVDPETTEFEDTDALDIVGIYPSYAQAYTAWRGQAARTIDDAMTRYFIVHIHRLIDPDTDQD